MKDKVMGDAVTLYKTDFFAWTKDQAEALRNAARSASAGGTNQELDWENVAEEIESLGRSERAALASQIRRILHHLLKLEFAASEWPRETWCRSIREARVEVAALIDENPSLRTEVERLVARQVSYARTLALGDLEQHGEATPELHRLMATRAYDPNTEILSAWMPGTREPSRS